MLLNDGADPGCKFLASKQKVTNTGGERVIIVRGARSSFRNLADDFEHRDTWSELSSVIKSCFNNPEKAQPLQTVEHNQQLLPGSGYYSHSGEGSG